MLTEEVQSKYNSIRLLERYKSLSESFQGENPFEKYDTTLVLKMLHSLGYDFSYNEKESFFSYKILENGFDFRVNLSLKYGVVETIIWAKNLNTSEQYGGPVSRIVKLIQASKDKDNQLKILYPRFSTYEDLEQIVRELMSIFYDFKSVVRGAV
jgi:hypothetical protein